MRTIFQSGALRRLLLALTAVALMTGYGVPASATAIFSYDGSLTMTLDSVSSADIIVTSFVFDDGTPFVDEFGTGLATGAAGTTTTDDTVIGVGDSAAVSNSGSGTATLPDGLVVIESFPLIDIFFENTGMVENSAVFTISWDLHTTASTTESLLLESAFADIFAFAILDEASGFTEIISLASSSDGLFGPADNAGSTTFGISIGAEDFAVLSLELEGIGSADAFAVPEPGTVVLLALGLIGVASSRRRTGYARKPLWKWDGGHRTPRIVGPNRRGRVSHCCISHVPELFTPTATGSCFLLEVATTGSLKPTPFYVC
tara:strand:- start:922 stop:1872 length:951 start_codon:yes stop_codon:yes gene_type:complete